MQVVFAELEYVYITDDSSAMILTSKYIAQTLPPQ